MTAPASRYVDSSVRPRIVEVPLGLEHAPTSDHLRRCADCREMEAQSFAELLEYSAADVPNIGYFNDYYSVDHLTVEQIEAIRERIIVLCKPDVANLGIRMCRAGGCVNVAGEGPYCPRCLEEISSLIAHKEKPSRFDLKDVLLILLAVALGSGVGVLVAHYLFGVYFWAFSRVWPDGAL